MTSPLAFAFCSNDDEFWRTHQGALYPDVGADTTRLVNEFKTKLESINAVSASESMQNALEMAPHVLAQKKSLDMHTTIAQALYNELEKRSIPEFYHVENDALDNAASSRTVNLQSVKDMLDKGTLEDKKRLICCIYTLCKDQEAKINSLSHLLKVHPSDAAVLPALKFLRYQDGMGSKNAFEKPQHETLATSGSAPNLSSAGVTSNTQNLGELGNKAKGWFFLSLKQLINLKQRPKIVSLIEGLSAQSKISEHYDTLDPLGVPGDVRQTSASNLLVFILGGASYVEADAISKWASESGKSVLFGSTSFTRPADFLQQLTLLGDEL